MEDEEDNDRSQRHGMDLMVQELQVASSRFIETTSDVLLDAAGTFVFGFIEPNDRYQPKTALTGDDSKASTETNLTLKKPAKIREEVTHRNKQLLEGAFHGTLHLYVDYAGEFKYLKDLEYRLDDRLENLKEELNKKYPIGTYDMLGAGKYKILPEWDKKGKKQIDPQKLPPPPEPTKIPPRTSSEEVAKILLQDRDDLAKYEKMKKRALRIANDAKDAKKAKEMLEELTGLRKQLKDLESNSTKMRAGSVKDPEHTDPKHPQALERGQLIRTRRTLRELKEDKYPTSKTILETLLEAGADVNYANEDGYTALMFAARNGHLDTVKHLLNQNSIDTNLFNRVHRNAMHYAALFAHRDIVEALRKADRAVDRKLRDDFGMCPKDVAEREGLEVRQAKQRIWSEMVYKNDQFKLVGEMQKTDKTGSTLLAPVYSFFGIHDPAEVEVPDPACKVDPMTEDKFINRWSSAAKKCGPPVKP